MVACLLLGAKVTSEHGLLVRIMSGSVVLPQLGFVFMSVALGATKGHTNSRESRQQPVAMLVPKGHVTTRAT